MKILFLHGWHSVPGGVKPSFLKDHGHEAINPALPDDDFDHAVQIAQQAFDEHRPAAVVGSSRGGSVAMNIDSGDAWLVLLCPAWKRWGTNKVVKANTVILHSQSDDVVPFADSEELVRDSGLPNYTLVETGHDHRLADLESLELMLEACLMGKEIDAAEEEDVDILEQDWTGLCYTAALAWAREADDPDWIVVHGTVSSPKEGRRIEHAWCERGAWIADLARPIGARLIERETYYRVAQPDVLKRYAAEEAIILAIKSGHDGPWDE